MTYAEVVALADLMALDIVHTRFRLHQLGNGEWVIVIKAKDYHIWNSSDWRAYQQQEEAKRPRTRRTAREAV